MAASRQDFGASVEGRDLLVVDLKQAVVLRALMLRDSAAAKRSIRQATENGFRQPSFGEARRISEYARSVLGSDAFASWLVLHRMINGGFHEGWIPNNYYGVVAMPRINQGYSKIGEARSLARRIIRSERIPDVASFSNGFWLDRAGLPVARRDVKDVVFAAGDRVVVKKEGTNQGRGVSAVTASDFDLERLEALGNIVVQRYIVQHEGLRAISPNSVATLRVTTGIGVDGNIRALASYLLLGMGKKQVVQIVEDAKALVDWDGRVADRAFGPTWQAHREHPESRVAFGSVTVPAFAKAVDLCVELHRNVPQFGIIGWDNAINADGDVEIMEWNTHHPGITFAEATGGPRLKPLNLERFAREAALERRLWG